MAEEAEGEEEFAVLVDAFAKAELPLVVGSQSTLGNEPWDEYVLHMLKKAGVTVEMVNSPQYASGALHVSTQIVSEDRAEAAMTDTRLDEISFLDADHTDGIQVKLNNAFGWKVSIQEDIPDQGAPTVSARGRKRASVEMATKVVQSRNHYEIVVDCSTDEDAPNLRTTVAVAMSITINLAFAKDSEDDIVMTDNFPHVDQRRVDVMFINKHIVKMQVRSVPWSVFCVLLLET
jgi:hypothetical protein